MKQIIDADTHVDECDETWDYLLPSESRFRPVLLEPPERSEPLRLPEELPPEGALREPDLRVS